MPRFPAPVARFGADMVDAAKRYAREQFMDRAAALTYYSVLSIFPGLLVLVAVLGTLSPPATEMLTSALRQLAPADVAETISTGITGLQGSPFTAGAVAFAGLVGALWSASGYTGAFIRASNAIYRVKEGRPLWMTLGMRVGITIAVGLLIVVALIIIVFTGRIADVVGEVLGAGGSTVTVWNIAKWPVLLFVLSLLLAIMYWMSPNAIVGRFRLISAGGLVAVVAWVVASAGFALYASNASSYDRTYGTLGGVIAFLVWLWLSNNIVLYGALLTARRLERGGIVDADGAEPRRQRRRYADHSALSTMVLEGCSPEG